MTKVKTEARLIFGGVLVVLGILFLLDNFYYIRIEYILSTYWPLILVVLGLWKMIRVRNVNDGGALFLIILGIFLQVLELRYIYWWHIERYWPVVLILIGLWILIANSPLLKKSSPGDDFIHEKEKTG